MNYVLVPEARNDLLKIFNYIANDSIESALRVHGRFLEVFELLAENPNMGHYRDDLTTKPVRFFPVYSYLVVYLADTSPVQIVRVLGGAQDVETILN
ncbi:MAG TPA: type II toxin-antitoxin system RelE/ParE family toxin [Bacteroidetes bacterium]|nr:type II toxin-antitoxin system RelE/ParE family toxin [Bacteroidota bacterium]HEX04494.1 type II toxin-antitoxin system RelE/ParE family toxin [Bacteroidota bacterium]